MSLQGFPSSFQKEGQHLDREAPRQKLETLFKINTIARKGSNTLQKDIHTIVWRHTPGAFLPEPLSYSAPALKAVVRLVDWSSWKTTIPKRTKPLVFTSCTNTHLLADTDKWEAVEGWMQRETWVFHSSSRVWDQHNQPVKPHPMCQLLKFTQRRHQIHSLREGNSGLK